MNDNPTNTERFYKEIFEDHIYDVGIPDRQNMTVIDIGGHVGTFTRYIYDKADNIYVCEPYEPLFKTLLGSVTLMPKAHAFNIGIGGVTGPRKLYIKGGDGGSSIKYEDGITTDTYTMTLRDFMYENEIEHVDLIKCDCEGAEEEIFGCADFQLVAPKIDYIVGEIHSGIDLTDRFTSLGFEYKVHKYNVFTAKRI